LGKNRQDLREKSKLADYQHCQSSDTPLHERMEKKSFYSQDHTLQFRFIMNVILYWGSVDVVQLDIDTICAAYGIMM